MSDIRTCPQCDSRVIPKQDGTCPSCGRSFDQTAPAPGDQAAAAPSGAAASMDPENPYAAPQPLASPKDAEVPRSPVLRAVTMVAGVLLLLFSVVVSVLTLVAEIFVEREDTPVGAQILLFIFVATSGLSGYYYLRYRLVRATVWLAVFLGFVVVFCGAAMLMKSQFHVIR